METVRSERKFERERSSSLPEKHLQRFLLRNAQESMNAVTLSSSAAETTLFSMRTTRKQFRNPCDYRCVLGSLMWPQQKDEGSAVSNSSFEASVAALLRAEAAQTGVISSNGGTGAGGRFTAVEELTEVLCAGGTLCGRELYRFLNQCSTESEPERAPPSNRVCGPSFTFASNDLASALAASEELSRPLAVVILCLNEHDGHLQQSSALWRELSSPGRLLELLQKRVSCWVVGIRKAYQCCRLHELIAAHALPVILIFTHKKQRVSLLETLACTGGTTEFIIQRIEEICDLYGPLLRINTLDGVFGGLHAGDEGLEAGWGDEASQVDKNLSQNRRE